MTPHTDRHLTLRFDSSGESGDTILEEMKARIENPELTRRSHYETAFEPDGRYPWRIRIYRL